MREWSISPRLTGPGTCFAAAAGTALCPGVTPQSSRTTRKSCGTRIGSPRTRIFPSACSTASVSFTSTVQISTKCFTTRTAARLGREGKNIRLSGQRFDHDPGGRAVRIVTRNPPELRVSAFFVEGLRGQVVLCGLEMDETQPLHAGPALGSIHERRPYVAAPPRLGNINRDDMSDALRRPICNQKPNNLVPCDRYPGLRAAMGDEGRELLAGIRNAWCEARLIDSIENLEVVRAKRTQ